MRMIFRLLMDSISGTQRMLVANWITSRYWGLALRVDFLLM